MTRTGKGWRIKLNNRLVGVLNFLIWLLRLMDRDKRIYLLFRDIEYSSLGYLLMAYHEAVERVVKFPRHGNALEAIERIEAEMKRRDGLEFARSEAEHLERNAIYEELERRDDRERERRKHYPENFTNWSGILQAWYRRDRRCRLPPKPR
jgi:hypothetical protein